MMVQAAAGCHKTKTIFVFVFCGCCWGVFENSVKTAVLEDGRPPKDDPAAYSYLVVVVFFICWLATSVETLAPKAARLTLARVRRSEVKSALGYMPY